MTTAKFTTVCILALTIAMDTNANELEASQVWTYESRPADSGSTVTIGEIENHAEMGVIVHISVEGVRLGKASEATQVGHLPVSEASLNASLIELVDKKAVDPSLYEGIETWRAANGGVFTISVAEAIGYIDEVIASGSTADE